LQRQIQAVGGARTTAARPQDEQVLHAPFNPRSAAIVYDFADGYRHPLARHTLD
jgi:hypothetical protein